MRSVDKNFMNEVFMLLIDDDRFEQARLLAQRLDNLMIHAGHETIFTYTPSMSKIDFLLSDSQMGKNWYRNK